MVFKKHGCGIMNTVITILLSRLDVFPTLRELEILEIRQLELGFKTRRGENSGFLYSFPRLKCENCS